MSSWLNGLSIMLAMLGLGLGVAWWNTRKHNYAWGAGAAAVLLGCIWLFGLFVETDESQIKQQLHDMVGAVKARDLDRIFAGVSDNFHYHASDKRAFRARVEEAVRNRDVHDISIWDFQVDNLSREKRTASVSFYVKVHGNWSDRGEHWLCRANFALDSDDRWRLAGFKICNPFVETDQEIAVPGL